MLVEGFQMATQHGLTHLIIIIFFLIGKFQTPF